MSRASRLASLSMMAGLFVAANMRGVNQAFPQNLAKVPVPPHIAGMTGRDRRRLHRKEALKIARRRANECNRLRNREGMRRLRSRIGKDHVEVQAVIQRMTNHQRCLWQRAGAWRNIDVVTRFAAGERA